MPGPVERWLETFMCKQYANVFEAFGFKTLQSVCQLQSPQLQAMGVAQEHCDKIVENVHVLRQTLSLSGTMNYQDEMSGNGPYGPAGNGMSHPSHPAMGYPSSDTNQMAMMGQYAAMQGYRDQVQNQSMMSPPHYPNAPNVYRNQQQQQQHQQQIHHQHQQQQQFINQQFNNMYTNQNFGAVQNPMMMNAVGPGNPMFGRPPGPQTQGSGSPSLHPPPHPHLRQGLSQNPQQVADNILQMASSTYSNTQTVQVPLNKGRSAPYHNPRTNYNVPSSSMPGMQVGLPPAMGNRSTVMAMQQGMNMQASQPRQVMQPTGSPSRMARNNAQFGFPSSSPHPHQPRTSPISPMPMHSPASQHSNQSIHNNPSPGPLQSPTGTGSIRSPVSPNIPVGGMQSPCGKQPTMLSASPASQQLRSPNQHIPHMNSPMMNCTPISSPGIPMVHNNMRSPLTPQSQQHHSPHPQYYHLQQTSQPQGHYSPASHSINSPLSHTSSPPYLQGGGRTSPPLSSPHSSVSKPSPSGSTGSSSYVSHPPPSSHQKPAAAQFNPLQSLQKLVMLPETQVVDPKSVVNDACLSSPSQEPGLDLEPPKNCDNSTDSSRAGQLEGKCVDGKHCESTHSVTPTPSSNSGQPCAEPKSDKILVQTNSIEAVSQSTEQPTPVDTRQHPVTEVQNVTENLAEKQTLVNNVCNDPPVQNSHVQEKTTVTANFATDRKQGIGNKEVQVQKSKQENMSPKKRFLGSQPMMNGSPAMCDNVRNSNSGSELTTNGKDKINIDSSMDKLRAKIPYSPICSSQKVVEHKISEPDSNGMGDTDTYVNKKFFKKRRMVESHPVSVEITSCGNSDVSGGQVSCSVTSVIQSPPHLTAPVYDDVSDPSDIEEELSVRKDSIVTYTRENRDYLSKSSSEMFKSISARPFPNHHSDSDGLDNGDSFSKPLHDLDEDEISPTRKKDLPTEAKSDDLSKLSDSSGDEQKSLDLTNHEELSLPNSPFSNISECSKSLDIEDEPDAIVSISDKLTPKIKSEPKVTKNSKFKANSLTKEVPFRTKKQIAEKSSRDESVDVDHNRSLALDRKRREKDFSDMPVIKSCEIPLVAIGKTPTKATKPVDIRETSKSVKSDSKVGGRTLDSQRSTEDLNKDDECSRSSAKGDTVNETSSKSLAVKRKSLTDSSSGDASASDIKTESSPVKIKSPIISESDTPKKRGLKKWKTSLARASESSSVEQNWAELETKSPEVKNVKSASSDEVVDRKPVNVQIAPDIGNAASSSKTPVNNGEQRVKKRRGRPPGSKNKVKKDKYTKRKRDVYEYNSDEEKKSSKSSKKSLTMNSPAGSLTAGKRSAGRPVKRELPVVGAIPGPFVRLYGSKRKPNKCVVMNAPQDESESKPVKKKKITQPSTSASSSVSIQLSNLPSDRSVLVPGMSPSDETLWYCCICRKHSSYKFLGDLFGPYYPEGYQPAPSMAEDGSEKPKQRRKKMFVLADQVPNYAALMKPVKSKKVTGEKKLSSSFELASGAIADSDELWVHEDCVLWSDGVYLIDNNLYGLEEAANVAATAACSCCKEVGASIGCLHKGCSQKYHYVCAVEAECYLDEENFSLLCLKHKEKRTKITEQSSRKVS